jgi:lipopolysaccharide/colanic/teichoic acid biosynthesis glycosyltransferase
MEKRIFDVFFSILGLIFIFPLLIIIGLIIKLDSKGNAFYIQERIGKKGKSFKIYKFRTMYLNSDKKGLLSLGENDNRITKIGHFLRKFKLDELPQLINILKGEMSFVGPRPEVQKYVDLYTKEQLKILNVKPGITDLASIHFFEEEQLLGKSDNPEKTYITEILPKKIKLNKEYLKNVTLTNDIKIIIKTVYKILKR